MGLPQDFANSADRLARNLKAAQEVIEQDEPDARPTAFVEDSTFLGMNPRLVETFAMRAEALELSIRFGGQATFDQILQRAHLLPLLKRCGLDYVFIGLETPHPDEIGGMHKDIGWKKGSWMERGKRVFETLVGHGIEPEVSLLFGLGESEASRAYLFEVLAAWQRRYGMPRTISMNWAVQHPLQGQPGTVEYQYLDWAIQGREMLEALCHFGEASTEYPMAGVPPPRVSEVRSVIDAVASVVCTRAPVVEEVGSSERVAG